MRRGRRLASLVWSGRPQNETSLGYVGFLSFFERDLWKILDSLGCDNLSSSVCRRCGTGPIAAIGCQESRYQAQCFDLLSDPCQLFFLFSQQFVNIFQSTPRVLPWPISYCKLHDDRSPDKSKPTKTCLLLYLVTSTVTS